MTSKQKSIGTSLVLVGVLIVGGSLWLGRGKAVMPEPVEQHALTVTDGNEHLTVETGTHGDAATLIVLKKQGHLDEVATITIEGKTYFIQAYKLCYHGLLPAEVCD